MDRPAISHKRLDIQGLRAVALLGVIAFHAGLPIPGAFTFLDIFFVISGYVICGMLLRELSGGGGVTVREFYARRLRRLLPALSVMVTITLILSWYLQNPYGALDVTARTGVGAMLLSANAVLFRAGGSFLGVLDHTWSLSVEEQFYLVLPGLLLFGLFLGRLRRHKVNASVWVLVAFTVVSLALSVALSGSFSRADGVNQRALFAYYSPVTRAWEFAIGCLLAFGVSGGVPEWIRRFLPSFAVVGLTLLFLSATRIPESSTYPGYLALVPVLATVFLILAGNASNFVTSTLRVKPLVWMGDFSYSWYLWHWPVIVLVAVQFPLNEKGLIFAAVGSAVPAYLAYRFVENPIRRSKRFAGRRAMVGLTSVCVAVPVLQGTLILTAPPFSGTDQLPLKPAATWDVDGCIRDSALGNSSKSCTYPLVGREDKGTILLVGDSHAAAVSSVFVAGAHSLGMDAVVDVSWSCPIVPAAATVPICRNFLEHVNGDVSRFQPDLIVVTQRSAHYSNSSVLAYDEKPGFGEQPCLPGSNGCAEGAEAVRIWADGLSKQVGSWTAEGSKVLVLSDVPEQMVDGPAMTSRAFGVRIEGTPRSDVVQRRDEVVRAEAQLPRVVPGTRWLDPLEEFCDQSFCSLIAGNEFLYVDSHNLSLRGADRLRALLDQTMPTMIA